MAKPVSIQPVIGSKEWFANMRKLCTDRLGYDDQTTEEVMSGLRKIANGKAVGTVWS